MALDILSDPFAGRADTTLDESTIRDVAPSLPDTKVQSLLRAVENNSWDKQEGINERYLLDKRLANMASTLSAELGVFALDAYSDAQSIISAAVLRTINDGNITGSFRGTNARGGSQWDIQQLSPQSFQSGTFSGAGSAPTRIQSTGVAGGDFDVIPYQSGTTGDGTYSPADDTQSFLTLGYFSTTNPRAIDQLQVGIDDGETRTPDDVYVRSNLGTLQAYYSGSVEYVEDDDEYDLNARATQDVDTDFFPFGVNIDTAGALPGLGVQS